MADKQLQPVVMEGMRIIFRNFEGRESEFNQPGAKNFGVVLPPDVAERMAADGWNVKTLKPSEEEKEEGLETGPPWLPIKVRFDVGKPPKVLMITSRGKTRLDDDTIEQLDWIDIAVDEETGQPKVDLIVRPYHWTNSFGATGVSAYLQSMYITVEEDELERKYSELDEQ